MNNNSNSNKNDIRAKSEIRWFYNQLESAVKRFSPSEYAVYATQKLLQSCGDIKLRSKHPLHFILHSIEANFAYSKHWANDPVTYNRFAKIINTYHKFEEPLLKRAVEENLDRMFLMMYRQQIELQRVVHREDIARIWYLYIYNNPLPKAKVNFQERYGLTMQDWIIICQLAYLTAISNKSNLISMDVVSNSKLCPKDSGVIDAFIENSCLTPKVVGERFIQAIKNMPLGHFLRRSIFFDYPIVDLGNNIFLAPHNSLLLLHSWEGLYRVARKCKHFDNEFGRSFQKYVGKVLCNIVNCNLVDDRSIRELSSSKSCDFLLELTDEIILIECKATTYTANNFTNNAIMNNTSTGQVVKGLSQLYATAHDIKVGKYKRLLNNTNKPIFGVVVTYGEINLVNSDWYYSLVVEKTKNPSLSSENSGDLFCKRPIIISIAILEQIASLINYKNYSLNDLYIEKDNTNYHVVGDWDTFISNIIGEHGNYKPLPFVEELINEFISTFN